MNITRTRALRGPNLWSRNTAMESIVVCTAQECDFTTIAGFEERVRARFPAIGGLQAQGVDNLLSMAHVLESAALALQAQAGCPVTFSRTAQTIEAGTYQVVVEYSEEEVGRLALELAQTLCQAAVDDTPFDVADALHRLRELDEDVRLGPSTGSIVYAAVARNIPFRRLTHRPTRGSATRPRRPTGPRSATRRAMPPTRPQPLGLQHDHPFQLPPLR